MFQEATFKHQYEVQIGRRLNVKHIFTGAYKIKKVYCNNFRTLFPNISEISGHNCRMYALMPNFL